MDSHGGPQQQQGKAAALERMFVDGMRESLEVPHNRNADLGTLSRASVQCHNELVEAAQQELQDERKHRHNLKLQRASKHQAAAAAEQLLRAPAGFAKFSARLMRFYRQHGIEWPTVTVEYRNVGVTTKALVGSAGVPTVGNVLVQAAKDLFSSGGQTLDLHILKEVNGVLKPGAMTLLLGSPGSGKSTLQKLLSGRLKGKHLKVSGSVTFNGKDFSQFVVERTAAYVDQHDKHLPVLTVGETLEFAHACSGARPDFISKQELQEVYSRSKTGGMSKSQSAFDTAELSGGSITTEVQGEPSSRKVADAVMGTTGFVHCPGEKEEFDQEEFANLLRLSGTNFRVELVLRLLGLTHARDTMIGSAMVRGVSGGERKRVTSGEMLVGNQRVLMMDEISTGLDSATLYSIITFLKQSVGALQTAALISLLQPPPEVMGLFDDVMIMAEGHVIYHGPVAEVQQHFVGLGFDLPARMDLPSWLVEITTPTGQWKYARSEFKLQWSKHPDNSRLLQAAASHRRLTAANAAAAVQPAASVASAAADWDVLVDPPVDPGTGKLPMLRSSEALNKDFWEGSKLRSAMMQELEKGTALPAAAANPRSLVQQRFALGALATLKLALKRQWTLFLRNKAFLVFRLLQVLVMGCIIGSLFFNVSPDRSGVRVILGASFITVLFLAFGSAPELGLLLMNRPIWYKHRNNLFLPTYAETLSMALVRAFNTALDSVLFTNIVYWMVGYTRTAGAYFTYLLVMFWISLAMSGLFRFIGASAATPVHAQAFGALFLLMLILTSGFAIVRPSIPGWWIWVYYLSPFAYALRSIAINEMSAGRWAAPAPGNAAGLTLGEEGLELFGFFTGRDWIWAGVGYLVGFTLLMNLLAQLALKHYSGQQERASVPDKEDVLKRRLKAEQRKQQVADAAALTILEGTTAAHQAAAAGALTAAVCKDPRGQAAGGAAGDFSPITLVVRDLRYFVPNPAIEAGRGKGKASSKAGPAAAAPAPQPTAAGAAEGGASSGTPDGAVDGAPVVVVVSTQVQQSGSGGAGEVPAELELLKGINMFTEPGHMCALMGGSGAGKTTLMDVIAGRKTVGRTTGDILVNGQPKQQASWARQVGYVEQQDIHSPAATVAEALWFSGRLRLPPSVSDSQVRTRVDEVMAQVDLTERASDLVGAPGLSGLPTEARKRLTIAVELVANPPVVFMDEPTSGLDARAAAIVMNAVKAVANAGHTTLVTIHQPSINIFEAFDQLLLLQRGGRCTYFGPLGLHSSALVQYLEAVPGTSKLLPGYNPATWMLEVTGGAMATLTPANTSVDWPAHYLTSDLCVANVTKAEALVEQGRQAHSDLPGRAGSIHAASGEAASGYAQPFRRQLLECTRKLSLAYWRMPSYNLLRLLMTVACGLVYGSMYYKVGKVDNPASIGNVQNVMGVLFSATNFLGNINLMSGMPVFSTERVVFYRERATLMYTPLALGFATLAAELPYVLAQTSLFVPIVYFMIDFQMDAAKFWYYYLMTAAALMMMTSFGLFLVSATPMVELAQLLSSALNFLFNVFNGFTITYSSIPNGWRWANRIVPATWIIYGLGASQLGDNHGPLRGPGLPAGTTASQYLLDVYGYEYGFRWRALLIVAGYVLGFMILGVLFMHKSFLKR